jgi:starch phosphorylase
MKVAPNGGLNLSILDGWWAEVYTPEVGWALGGSGPAQDPEAQDEAESRALYELLEREVVPLFHQRGPDGVPSAWMARVKASIKRLCPIYNTDRMVTEYAERFYLTTARAAGAGDLVADAQPRQAAAS